MLWAETPESRLRGRDNYWLFPRDDLTIRRLHHRTVGAVVSVLSAPAGTAQQKNIRPMQTNMYREALLCERTDGAGRTVPSRGPSRMLAQRDPFFQTHRMTWAYFHATSASNAKGPPSRLMHVTWSVSNQKGLSQTSLLGQPRH